MKGSIYALSSPDGEGVIFKVKFSNIPSEGGPFSKSGTFPTRLDLPADKRQSTTSTTSPSQKMETAPQHWLTLTLMSGERRPHATPTLLRPVRLAICLESMATSPATLTSLTPTTSLP